MKPSFTGCLITLATLVVVLGAYGVFRVTVGSESVAVLRLTNEIEAKAIETKHLARVREQLSALANDEAAVDSYFVPETGVVAFINELQARGQVLGSAVEIASVAAVPAGKNGARPSLTVALAVSGPFDAVVRTVGSIEYAPYAISIQNLSLSQGNKDWLANLTLSVGAATDTRGSTTPLPAPTPVAPTSTPPVAGTTSPP